MPEVITKYPDVVLKVLSGGGARCGGQQERKILTKCPPERFCSTPTGETCVYGIDEIGQMTQVKKEDLFNLVCSDGKHGEKGCGMSSADGALVVTEMAWLAALTFVTLALLAVRRARRHGPPG